MLESLLNKVAALQDCNFTKKRLQHRCFPVNVVKFFWTPILKNIFRTAASVHFEIKRRIQHPAVKYLRCFCKKLLVRCLTVWNEYISEKKSFYRGGQISSRPLFLKTSSDPARKNGWSKPKCSSNLGTTRNICFCSLLPKPDLQFSF